jgi:D-psicose/D-tagatose/L-ribulose 3-epimerase
MRKIGCCTWIFGECQLGEVASRVSAAGLDGVELFGDWQNVNPQEAKTILGDHGLEVFSLTPSDADISHPDPSIRKTALDYYKGLIDFAAELGNPLISCHGQVTRIKPVSSQAEEDALLLDAADRICNLASASGLSVVFEILNRYETHQIRTVSEGLSFLRQVDAHNLSLLPDAYHMNIEESDPAAALLLGGRDIGLYHAADSNRCGIGQGHTDFAAQFNALDKIKYNGPIILEVAAPGPNPFTPDKGEGFRDTVASQLTQSVKALRALGT